MKGRVFGAFCLASLLFSSPYAVTSLSAQGLRVESDASIDWQILDALIPRRSILDPTIPDPVDPVLTEAIPESTPPEEAASSEPEPAPVEPIPVESGRAENKLAELDPEETTPEESEPEKPAPAEPAPEEPEPESILSKYPQLAGFPPYIIFSLDQLVLAQAHRHALDPFADLLKAQPSLRLRLHSLVYDRHQTYQKRQRSSSSSNPSMISGQVLRAAISRARSVENYLVEKGIDEARIEIITTEQSGPAAHRNRVEFDFHE